MPHRYLPGWFRERVSPVPDDQSLPVSTIELFFDLVFVFAVTQLTKVLEHDFGVGSLRTVLMFAFIWYMYAAFAWVTNAVPPVRGARRILLLAAMAGWLVVAMAVPEAFDHTGVWFGAGMIFIVVVHGLLYLQSTTRILPFVTCNLIGAVLILVAALVPSGIWQYVLWLVALLAMWAAPVITGQEGFFLHPGHITERHGLVVIVSLGESVLVVGRTASELELGVGVVGVAIVGLALSATLWWTYFTKDATPAEHAIAACTDQVRRTRMVLVGYFFCHIPILLGIIAIAAAVGSALHDLSAPLHGGAEYVLSAGAAVFLCGTQLFRMALRLPVGAVRTVGAVAALAVIPVGHFNGVAQLIAVTAVLMATVAWESVAKRRRRVV